MNKKNYDEFKITIVKLLNTGEIVKYLSEEYGVSEASINRWKKDLKTKGTSQDKTTSQERLRIKASEKELKEIRLERDILKRGGKHLFQERQVKYGFIKNHTGKYPVEKMCYCMKVSKNAYYTWLRNKDKSLSNNFLESVR
ncbi:'integrase catalytic subunit [Formosa agariphila KMM 3901]|uniref:'integrase catalytic subunit n=1 Tax=Formosa agariphila (strain DSM 15362 / KCTC 12365 / LMG 23005 / KMM 3901 / M-2Alg 35-1) TaxID=1347342 RepID=T2KLL1_FORAG|nr:'integrase catalytic subunit [Formosa agariphila KMM 3901]